MNDNIEFLILDSFKQVELCDILETDAVVVTAATAATALSRSSVINGITCGGVGGAGIAVSHAWVGLRRDLADLLRTR